MKLLNTDISNSMKAASDLLKNKKATSSGGNLQLQSGAITHVPTKTLLFTITLDLTAII